MQKLLVYLHDYVWWQQQNQTSIILVIILLAVRYNELDIVMDIFFFCYLPAPFIKASSALIQLIDHYKYHREMK